MHLYQHALISNLYRYIHRLLKFHRRKYISFWTSIWYCHKNLLWIQNLCWE